MVIIHFIGTNIEIFNSNNNTNIKINNSSTSRTNNDINNIIKSLEFKLEKKKIEIKKLESNNKIKNLCLID